MPSIRIPIWRRKRGALSIVRPSNSNAASAITSCSEQKSALPGVREYIAEAKRLGLHLGVASSSSREWVVGHLTELGLSAYFDCIKCRDDVPRVKPDPALYQAVVETFALQPSQAIALEDSPNGIAAAKRAGLFCVAVPNPLTRQLSLAHADLLVSSLADLPLQHLLEHVQRHGR